MSGLVFRGVVASAGPGGRQQDPKHFRVAPRGPEREGVESNRDQEAGNERVEEVERSGTDQQRQEEQTAIDTAL